MPNTAVSEVAARAAAFAIAILLTGAEVLEVSTEEAPDADTIPMWMPWAVSLEVTPKETSVAILAAEIIARRPERAGHGARWDSIELDGLEMAARITRIKPEVRDPLFAVFAYWSEPRIFLQI